MYRQSIGGDRGQITIAMVGVIVVIFGLALGLVAVGRAAIDRARARTAADAVVLAGAVNSSAGDELARWYEQRGTHLAPSPGSVRADVGDSQAAAWAGITAGQVVAAPAVVAIIERASQILGQPLAPLRIDGTDLWLARADADAFVIVAGDFGMCFVSESDASTHFRIC